ncbi:MAG: hypothetical protein Q8N63_06850 [Nanoarchaeota archaeon]|nr:hypothetical protein [Nanoarchaeota archaeon]
MNESIEDEDYTEDFIRVLEYRFCFDQEQERNFELLKEAHELNTGRMEFFSERMFKISREKYQQTLKNIAYYQRLIDANEDSKKIKMYKILEDFLAGLVSLDKENILATNALYRRIKKENTQLNTAEEGK